MIEFPSRNIALCISEWRDITNVMAWSWLNQFFLQPGVDRLFIVHTGKRENWKIGGPLCDDLDTSLAEWPHEVHTVDGSLQSNIDAFVKKHNIHIVVLGEDYGKQTKSFQVSSVSDWVKQHITVPYIIIVQSAVRNQRLRLNPRGDSSPTRRSSSPLPEHGGRKIAIAYSSFEMGTKLIDLAKQLVISHADEIYLVHAFPAQSKQAVVRQTKKLVRTITLQKQGIEDKVNEDNSIDFGAQELEGYNVHLNVPLKGDPKSSVTQFCEDEKIDLLIIGTRAAGRIRKTLGGGSVSGYLIDHAPCPCLVVPYSAVGMEDDNLMSPKAMHRMSGELELDAGASMLMSGQTHMLMGEGKSTPAAAGISEFEHQLIEKDRLIADLRQEVQRLRLELAHLKDTDG